MLAASLLIALSQPVAADTGQVLCKDWTLKPDAVTTTSGWEHLFRIDTLRECRDDMECVWSLTSDVGSLQTAEGLNVWWDAPPDPPEWCEPLDTSLVATCVLWGSFTRTASADIQVRCTDEEREQLAQEMAELYTVQGGGCTSPARSEALLLLLPLGLFGLRRRVQG